MSTSIIAGSSGLVGNNILKQLCEKNHNVIAIGDGANDIEMMKIAGLSVAYHAKPLLKQYCNIQINSGSLKSLIDFFEEN